MQRIDFLPQRYRDEQQIARHRLWHLLVALMLGGVIAASATYQHWLRRELAREQQAFRGQYVAAQQTSVELRRKQQQLAARDGTAELYTLVQSAWPTTALLESVTAELPSSVTIRELQVVSETEPMARSAESVEPTQIASPEAEDLKRFRRRTQQPRQVIRLLGSAADLAEFDAYVHALRAAPLLREVELETVQQQTDRGLEDLRPVGEASMLRPRPGTRPASLELMPPSGPAVNDFELLIQVQPAGSLNLAQTRQSDAGISENGNPSDKGSAPDEEQVASAGGSP